MRKALHYVGNRGIVLGLLGLIWMLAGVGLVLEPVSHPGLLHELLPVPVRFCFWFIPGAFAVISVGIRRLDEWAWVLLILPPAIRLLSYLTGWVMGTYPQGWRGAVIYVAVVLLINRCAAGLDRPAPWDGRERRRWVTGPL